VTESVCAFRHPQIKASNYAKPSAEEANMSEQIENTKDRHPDHNHHEEKEKHLTIFVNRLKFDETQEVKKEMSVDEIARLVGMTSETAIVRRLHGPNDVSDPLEGELKIKNGDQFSVTRRQVKGGFSDRVQQELSRLRESSMQVEVVQGSGNQSFVIYRGLQTNGKIQMLTDVMVPVPVGYPAVMIDMAALPADCCLIGRVEGSPQGLVEVGGRSWRLISYHPHNGGGGPAWNPSLHGFHTYLAEILSWLEVRK